MVKSNSVRALALFVIAGVVGGMTSGALGTGSSAVRVITIVPPEDCYICITSFNLNATASAYFVTDCPDDDAYQPDAQALTVFSTNGDCVNSQLQSISATSQGGNRGAECGNHTRADVLVNSNSGGLTIILGTAGSSAKICRGGCNILYSLLDSIASAEIAYEFRRNSDDSLCAGGMFDNSGIYDIPDSPVNSNNGRVVVFVPDACGSGQPGSLVRTVAGDCEGGIDVTGELTCGAAAASGSLNFSNKVIQFTDAQFDLDGNGRFNERDWVLIQALIGSTLQADLDRFNVCPEGDLNANGNPMDDQIIAQDDLDAIRAILDAGLDAGELGDCNGDDIVDCTDYAMLPASLTATICDANYKITLDADLDGDNDAADLTAVLALFPTADVVAPFGILDLTDITTLIAAFNAQTAPADFAPPFGIYDLTDLTTFTSAFTNPCP